jgi:hypothetical protein
MPFLLRSSLGLATLTLFLACAADPAPAPPPPPPLPEGASPVALCPVDSMIDAYPGDYPNQPNGPQPLASTCITAPHDVLVVLGCPNDDGGAPSACQTARVDIAVALMKAGYGDRFITTGGAVHNEWVEADTLRDLLASRGVPLERVTTEPLAEHTDENIYFSTRIMEERGFASAIVVSDEPGHLVLTGLCDSNCCVDLGRLTVVDLPIDGGRVSVGHYVRHPWAKPNTEAECAHIQISSKFMCTNLEQRRACKDDFQL